MKEQKALIFDIKRDCSEDGPGIRTTVFFKGCPLSCIWCQNPEGKEKRIENWSNSAESETVGYWISMDELLYRLLIDKPFYSSSGGGVTLSGGEVTQQLAFVHHLLKALKAEGIHTAIETSGFFNYRRFSELLLPWLDLIYFDLKLIDDAASRQYTGQGNRLILENFSKLIESASVPVIPRVPLIPGITTSEANLRGIADFLAAHNIDAATLLPYNPLWVDKVAKLGKTAQYQRTTFMTPQEKNQCVISFKPSHQGKRRVGHAN